MNSNGWSLEVVRGREVGRSYALSSGETIVGNSLNGGPGLDLGSQEGDGPRRMASRQAQIESTAKGLIVRDLDSPGGTFVNRQRLLPGQERALAAGDLIQLGGVQLKVVAPAPAPAARAAAAQKPVAAPQPAPAPPAPRPAATSSPAATAARPAATAALGAPFVLAGATCRSWDDFLTVSAQRWGALRDELVSGRLAAHLASAGNARLAPSPNEPGTPDERLDAWLAVLPTTRSSLPELDVHPETLTVRASAGGGLTRQVVAITNTGYRLLRTTVRVEQAAASWIRVAPEFARGPFVTIDRTELPLEVLIPEDVSSPLTGIVVIDGNGGTRRVTVRVERLAPPESIPELSAAIYGTGGPDLLELIGRQPAWIRLAAGSALGLLLRVLVAIGGLVPASAASPGATLALPGALLVFAAMGAGLAALGAARRGAPGDLPTTAFAGGCAGVLSAVMVVAACRAFEPVLSLGTTGACVLWTAIGAAIAGLSLILLPPPPVSEATP